MAQVSWQRAMSMWWGGRVEIVEEYEDRFIHTVSRVFKVPAIVRFVGNVVCRWRRNTSLRFSRGNIFLRDNGKCQYCNVSLDQRTFTLDHILPASKGGRKTWENIVACCPSCNQRKRNRTPDEARMKLLRKPKVPKVLPFHIGKSGVPSLWHPYLKKQA